LNSSESGICVTSPVIGLTAWQALLIEAITTGVLMLLVCAVWDPKSGNGDCGSLKFLVMIFLTSVVVVSILKCNNQLLSNYSINDFREKRVESFQMYKK